MGGKYRQDVAAWIGGLIFIAAFLVGLWGWGYSRRWDAPSGYHHHSNNNNTALRLLNEPFGCNETDVPGRHGVDCVAHWYYWKLPPTSVTTATRATVWLFYACHQILIWGLLFRAQMLNSMTEKQSGKKYRTDLRWFNWAMLSVNAFCHLLHLGHTHWKYDGLAQDVDVFSSQGAVIMMVVFIMLMEYKDRGMILMWPNPNSTDKVAERMRLSNEPIRLIRKYHGYAFSWAVVYTFWYHPMENTAGHILGFFHTATVMLQGSLVYTRIHLNRYWRLLNESWVLVHGTVVAVQIAHPTEANGSNFWPMFAFGFGFLLAFTQIFGLPFWRRISQWFRAIPPVIYVAAVLALCATMVRGRDDPSRSGFHRIYELCYIPAMFYIAVVIGWGSAALSLKVGNALSRRCYASWRQGSVAKQALYVTLIMFVYVAFIVVGYLTKDASVSGLLLMILYSLFFTAAVGVTLVWCDGLFARARGVAPADSNGNVPETAGKADVAHVNYVHVDEM